MRDNDDDAGDSGAPVGDLAGGLGETSGPSTSSTDPYGDTYGDDGYGDDSYGDDSYGDGSGDGSDVDVNDGTDGDVLIEDETDTDLDDTTPPADGDAGDLDISATDPEPEAADPLEGVGFLIDELHDALFGEDEVDPLAAAEADAAAIEAALDPGEVPTDTDLDLNGDGVVDGHDLHDIVSQFGLDGDGGAHGA
jgi:hypothetical protein